MIHGVYIFLLMTVLSFLVLFEPRIYFYAIEVVFIFVGIYITQRSKHLPSKVSGVCITGLSIFNVLAMLFDHFQSYQEIYFGILTGLSVTVVAATMIHKILKDSQE